MIRLEDIVDAVLAYNESADIDLIKKAYVYSAKVHSGQLRDSGEPYLSHPLAVAYLLTKLNMDEVSIAAGLLHDTIEDTYSTPEEIKDLFGEDVLFLVDGLTKIGRIQFSSEEEQQAENYRKMILALSKDIRVIIIKLVDRLHNMRTIDILPPTRKKRIAQETLNLYVPIAGRLGISWIKHELEEIAAQTLYKTEYLKVRDKLSLTKEGREAYINKVIAIVEEKLKDFGKKVKIEGRPKSFYSIHNKLQSQSLSLDEVYDLNGIRIVCETEGDCYSLLGIIHSIWTPVHGRIKDYIALPKANMYQSLHTTVVGPEGHYVEFQFRTEQMHLIAEYGIAAHWKYKAFAENKKSKLVDQSEEQFEWIRHMLEYQHEIKDPKEFLESMRLELYSDEVHVFTPKGEVKQLPKGSTALDFAYSIHTDIGHHCVGGRVDGRMVPLKYELQDGNVVDIITSSSHKPNQDLLKIAKTSRAKSKIRSFLKEEQREGGVLLGREIAAKSIRDLRLKVDDYLKDSKLLPVAQGAGFSTIENLFLAIGRGKFSVQNLISKIVPAETLDKIRESHKWSVRELIKKVTSKKERVGGEGIKIKGLDDILVRLAKCCLPVPGDRIVGLISRGRGIIVHSADCPNIVDVAYEPDQVIDVEWDLPKDSVYQVILSIKVVNKPGILGMITNAIALKGFNISDVRLDTKSSKDAAMEISIDVPDSTKLPEIIKSIKSLKGVKSAVRINKHSLTNRQEPQ